MPKNTLTYSEIRVNHRIRNSANSVFFLKIAEYMKSGFRDSQTHLLVTIRIFSQHFSLQSFNR